MRPQSLHLDPYIVQTLLRDLVGHDHRPSAFLVYLWLAAEEQRTSVPVAISYAALAEETGQSRSAVQAAAGWLEQRKLIHVVRASVTATPVYTTLRPWIRKFSPAD